MTTSLYWQGNMEYQAIRRNKLSSIMLNWRISLTVLRISTKWMQRFHKVIALKKDTKASLAKKSQTGRNVKSQKLLLMVGRSRATCSKRKIRASELVGVKILRSEGDVDQYINTLSNKLKQIIKSNKEIEFID